MLPRERVLTALKHREPDIVPWGEHSIDYNIYEQVLGRKTFISAKFRLTKAWWDGRREEIISSYKKDTLDLVDALGLDIIIASRMPSVLEQEKPMEKMDDETYRDDKGNIFRVSSVTRDLMPYRMNPAAYTPPTPESVREEIAEIDRNGVLPPHESCWEVVRHIVRERKKTHFIFTFWDAPWWPWFGQTDEDQLLNLALHPEMYDGLSELQGKRAIGSLKYAAELGVDAIMSCTDLGSSAGPLASPRIYQEYVLPWEKKYVAEAHRLGLFVIKHCCGMVWNFADLFVEAGFDAYEGIQASAGMDMKLLKERIGDKITLWGGVKNENLILGTPDDIRQDARYAIKHAAPGGGFILGASHSLAVGTKPENLLAMKEAREKWGIYPI